MLLGTLGASLLKNKRSGQGVIRTGERFIQDVKKQLQQVNIFNTASSFN